LQVLFLTIESVDHLEVIISQEQEMKQQQQQQQLDSANRLLHLSKITQITKFMPPRALIDLND
jgi:hypothetical protein